MYSKKDSLNSFPFNILHQYLIVRTFIITEIGYLHNSPYTIKVGVDCLSASPCKPPKNLYNEYYSCLTFYVYSVRDHVKRFICKDIWKMVKF